MPEAKLHEYLAALGPAGAGPNQSPGMDCAIVATRHAGLFSVTTTDFFYPLVESPYLQGRIGACNVLSDVYAVGVRADQLDTIATGAMHDRWVHTNPRKIDGPAVVRTLLDVAW